MSRSPPERRLASGEGEEGDDAAVGAAAAASASRPPLGLGRRRRAGDPSSSRTRSADAIFPEHFVESVAARVAIDAARSFGRLDAAPALVAVFQVCTTWRSVCRSELLWKMLCRRIWSRHRCSLPSWRDEYVRLHRTAANFRDCHSEYSHLLPPSNNMCCRLALSDQHLATGFFDGSVRLFELPSGHSLTTFRADPHRDRLGRYSLAISGIILVDELSDQHHLAFASQDGDIHVANLDDVTGSSIRRALAGNPMVDSTLVDFTGNSRWWVGLFAGVPGQSWRVWEADTAELVYVGGHLTDPDAIQGWRMLTDMPRTMVARARIAGSRFVVGCTSSRMELVDLEETGRVVNRVVSRHGETMQSMDACARRVMVVEAAGTVFVNTVPTLTEICRFPAIRLADVRPRAWLIEGCINWGYVLLSTPRGVAVSDARTGEELYVLNEQIGAASAMTASDRYVAAWAAATGLHLWDFGAQQVEFD